MVSGLSFSTPKIERAIPYTRFLQAQNKGTSSKKKREVVVVTRDGTKDANALHEADIGLSMDVQGIEVAKEISYIIILDDNFAFVVKVSYRCGRSVYANIHNFIEFQLTVNVAALAINFVATISSRKIPLNSV
ncbi:hypothetical protein SUGI_0739310 [Cryptomeria japonica]|nr:hypothetical protein SUGI_0739310 [Cryptomeria japonica]